MLLFMGFVFPLIGMMVFSYRASLLYFCVRDAAYKAATASTFSLAQTNANNAWTKDTGAWTGITSGGNPVLTIIITTNSTTPTTTTSATKLTTVDTTNNVYFMQVACTAKLEPLLGSGWKVLFMKKGIPGLNEPYTMKMTQQVYIENPNGLTN